MNRVFSLFVCLAVLSSCDESATEPNPPPIARPSFVSVSTGGATTCALTTEGDVYCWGAQYDSVPTLIPGDQSFRSITVSEAGEYDGLGYFHACGATETGRAYCWGEDHWGQLGNGENQPGTDGFGWVPEPVEILGNNEFGQLVAGHDNACGLTPDGLVYCWGQNGDGHLGTPRGSHTEPTLVPTDLRFVTLTSGRWFRCGITYDKETYCWGDDYLGQLGDGSDGVRVNPTPSRVVGTSELHSIASGWEHTCGLTAVGGVTLCWGQNHAGQLNDGTTEDRDSAVVSGLSIPSFASVDAGDNGTCGLTPEGRVFCWGDVVGPRTSEPVQVDGLPELVSLSVGAYYACGVSVDDWVYCWGRNSQGQLGRSWGQDRWARLEPAPISAPR
jgi:alpha-tubulin suppressor-like RCC1 family protein